MGLVKDHLVYCHWNWETLLRLILRPNQSSSAGTCTGLDVTAGCESLPEIAKEVGLLLDVTLAKNRCNSPCCLLGVVEGNTTIQSKLKFSSGFTFDNLREHVVNDMVLNDAVEDVAADETKIAVNG